MRQLRWIGFVILLMLMMFEVLVFAPESVNLPRRDKVSTEGLTKNSTAEQQLEGMQVVETKGGEKEWQLWSARAMGSREKGDWHLENVKVQVFGVNGVSYIITGDRGAVLDNRKSLVIDGHVVTRSSNGYLFSTDKVTYSSTDRTIHGPGRVHMKNEASVSNATRIDLVGQELVAGLADEHIKIMHNVHAVKGISDKQTISIRSERAIFSAKDASAEFEKNVSVEMDKSKITGPEAEFVLDPTSQKMKSLVVKGGARLSDADRWATAQRVDMLFDENRFILSGSPRVVQNSDELLGDQIVYANGGKDIFVNDVKARFDDETKERVLK